MLVWRSLTDAWSCRAYAPRGMWSGLHASPADAVEMFKDVRARRGVGMHWGCVSVSIFQPSMKACMLRGVGC